LNDSIPTLNLSKPVEPANLINLAPGLVYAPGFLDAAAQTKIAADIGAVVAAAPWFTPLMPRTGRPFSVRMSNCGLLGWVSDRTGGYRYQAAHPESGKPWPPIPQSVLAVWRALSAYPLAPEACLINFYGAGARMGPHQDRDEEDFTAPVVSISLGDACVFRYGGLRRRDRSHKLDLRSGDVVVLGGPARLAFHGVDRVLSGSSALFPGGGRVNLTLRRVTAPGTRR
jgi:alkylated DNA repair protein (DNA oxidative demethylase)